MALFNIPGHAEHHRDKVLQAQVRARSTGASSLSDYYREIMYGFETLKLLPSPEGVRVLGELLSNDWVPPGNDTLVGFEKFQPLAVSASVALQMFPLIDKPFNDPSIKENIADAQVAWTLWHEQIKSGKRTFRFQGDPIEYDLNGPAPGQKIAHISRDRKRDAERQVGRERTPETTVVTGPAVASKSSKSMPVALFIAGVVVLGAMGLYFSRWRNRKRS